MLFMSDLPSLCAVPGGTQSECGPSWAPGALPEDSAHMGGALTRTLPSPGSGLPGPVPGGGRRQGRAGAGALSSPTSSLFHRASLTKLRCEDTCIRKFKLVTA